MNTPSFTGVEAALAHGRAERAQNRLEEAIDAFQQAIVLQPASVEAHYQLGFTLSLQGRLDEAALSCRQALALDPSHAEAHNNLGYIHLSQGRFEEAAQCYQQAAALKPDYAKAHYNLGLALSLLNRPEAAVASYRRAIAADPAMGEAYHNLANLLLELNEPDQAAECYREALVFHPDNISLLHNLGTILANRGEFAEAIACYRRALALKPDHAECYYALGNTYNSQRKFVEAAASFRRALALRPDYADARYNLGSVLFAQDRLDEAVDCFQKTLALKPAYSAEVYCNLGNVLGKQGRLAEAVAYCRQALQQKPELAQAASNLAMLMLYTTDHSPAEVLAAHRAYAEQFETPLKPGWPAHTNGRDPGRRLKVGYVSPDFCLHSVAFFIEPLLAHHDKTAVETTGYHLSSVGDAVTERIRSHVDHWVPCAGMSDAALAERVRKDGIDILVDLAGHSGINALPVFARKPAPLQVTYLGYPTTTGLSAMDYRLTTWDVDPAGSEAWYTERLYRLPHTLWCYRPPAGFVPAPEVTPAARKGHVTFGSMNNIFKLSAETIALWSRILAALPGSRLLMTNVPAGSARTLLLERFATHGVDPHRLTLHARLPTEQFRALAWEIDLALDPFPYTGTTTTCEALWMGIPVITLIGQTSVSRSGYALLKSAGLTELCARDEADYVRLAVELARDLPRLNALRQGMRQRIESSPLRDEAGLARDIEAAYRVMWRHWCTS